MADFNEEIDLNFKTNAKSVQGSVDSLNVSIDKTTKSTKENNQEVEKQEASMKSFKTQLREANQELLRMSQTYGETSKEAVNAAKKVAELKDQMEFAKDLSDSFNPDQKFKALGAATNIAATSMTGITGAMGLFGDTSEDTEKMLLKVQSAMAFSQALSGLSDLGDQFKTLRTVVTASYAGLVTAKTADTIATEANAVAENQSFLAKAKNVAINATLTATTGIVTAAQWLWNAAVMANPIVALAVAVVALVAGLAYLTKSMMENTAENERAARANTKLNKEIDTLEKTTKKTNKELEINTNQTLAMAKASGASSEEIRKLSIELANQEIAEKKLNTVKAYSIYLEAKRVAGLEDATDAQKETLKKAIEFYNAQRQDLRDAVDKRDQIRRDNEVQVRQEETDARNKRLEDEKKHQEELAQKRKEARDREAAERKKAEEQRRQEEQEGFRRAENRYNDAEKIQRDARKANADALLTENEIKVNAENEEYARKLEKLQEFNLSTEELEAEHKRKIAELNDEYFATESDKAIARGEEEKKRADEEAQFQENKDKVIANSKENLNKLISGIEATGLAKSKAGQIATKALALTQIGIDTAVAITGATKLANAEGAAAALVGGPGAGTVARITSYAASGIQIATNLIRAKSLLSGGGSTGGGGNDGGGQSSPQTQIGSAPPQVGFQNSNENQIATSINNNQETQVIKAYVVGQDVTDQQTLDNNAITANSF